MILPNNPEFETPCPKAKFDGLSPPKTPMQVKCMHCDMIYSSDMIAWGRKLGMAAGINGDDPLWWCPVPSCDGGGFQHDIWPVKRPSKSVLLTAEWVDDTTASYRKDMVTIANIRDRKFMTLVIEYCEWLSSKLREKS